MGSNGLPDPVRCAEDLGDLIDGSAHPRVAAWGEFAPVLWKEGRVDAAMQMERLTDEFVRNHNIDIVCGYLSSILPPKERSPILERICAKHSAVYGLGH